MTEDDLNNVLCHDDMIGIRFSTKVEESRKKNGKIDLVLHPVIVLYSTLDFKFQVI